MVDKKTIKEMFKRVILEYDNKKDQDNTVFTIMENGNYVGHITKEGGIYITHGQIGEYNEFESLEQVLQYLQGDNISLDDLFF